MGSVVVAAVGSEYRRDDGVGPAVARRVAELLPGAREIGPVADPLELVGRWDGADLAVVADALRSGSPPGTVALIDLDLVEDPTGYPATSTHTLGLWRAYRLARALGRAPARVVVVGVEGAQFGDGVGLSPAVARAVPAAARQAANLVRGAGPCA